MNEPVSAPVAVIGAMMIPAALAENEAEVEAVAGTDTTPVPLPVNADVSEPVAK